MAKQRRKISNRHRSNFESSPLLPDNQEINQALNQIIETPSTKVTPIYNSTQKRGRPSLGKNRVKFTTMLDPIKRDKLKHIAIDRQVSLADLLDEMLENYIENHEKR